MINLKLIIYKIFGIFEIKDMSGLPAQPYQHIQNSLTTATPSQQPAQDARNGITQPIASKLPLSNVNSTQKSAAHENKNSIHSNLVTNLTKTNASTSQSNMKQIAIARGNTNDSLLNHHPSYHATKSASEMSAVAADEASNDEKSSSSSVVNTNQANNSPGNNSPNDSSSANATGKAAVDTPTSGYFAGYLLKWTNYIKGYQKRWFVLNNGLLSYFR